LEWRFFNHNLSLLTDICDEIKDISDKNQLNKQREICHHNSKSNVIIMKRLGILKTGFGRHEFKMWHISLLNSMQLNSVIKIDHNNDSCLKMLKAYPLS
jgi:hypothetical protein